MSWGLATALCMAALIALGNALRLCLIQFTNAEERLLDGRGLSPSLLVMNLPNGEGRA
jgi:hypothetical protein